jgi:formylglycine-generating enzyme required for sulfatase activity/energy-coupling factor transporter ATP-binding protein EcfA2
VVLETLVGSEHRRELTRLLNDDIVAAMQALGSGSPAGEACRALIAALTRPDPSRRPAPETRMVIEGYDGSSLRDIRQFVVHGDYHAAPDATRQARQAIVSYLRGVIAKCSALQLSRIEHAEVGDERPISLEQVYIHLETHSQVVERAQFIHDPERLRPRPMTVIEAIDAGRLESLARYTSDSRIVDISHRLNHGEQARLLLLGEPGSGKSTFVSYLALTLARSTLAAYDDQERFAEPPALPNALWTLGPLIPIRILLHDVADYLPLASAKRGSAKLLLGYLADTLGMHEATLDQLSDALQNGDAILMFDGLDEVGGDELIRRIVEMIEDAAGTYSDCPILVTCRTLDYRENRARQLRSFQQETLAALTDAQADQFITAWYEELKAAGREPRGSAASLAEAIRANPQLAQLARSPLLLTMVAVVHASRGTLPESRALLYAECIDLLLVRWRTEERRDDKESLLNLPNFSSSDLLPLMAQIGFRAHEQAAKVEPGRVHPTRLSLEQVRLELRTALTHHVADEIRREDLVTRLIHSIATRNGLLLKYSGERDQVYAFPHRTFQEFLAGYYLKTQRAYLKFCLDRAADPHWHEALLLMVSYQVLREHEMEKPLALATRLLESVRVEEQILAAEMLNLIGHENLKRYDESQVTGANGLWYRARRLLDAIIAGTAPATTPLRIRAGRARGELCYRNVQALCNPLHMPPLPLARLPIAIIAPNCTKSPRWQQMDADYWRPVNSGQFWHDAGNQRLARIDMPHAFLVGRYPVTNADFARFFAAEGKAAYRVLQPFSWGNPSYNNPLQPVVGVTWYDAVNYCAWLTAQGHAQGWLGRNEEIRLPTWLERERAARHTDQRTFPWGNEQPRGDGVCHASSSLDSPAPIGCFRQDVAACGAYDMAGSVAEWTATLHEAPESLVAVTEAQLASIRATMGGGALDDVQAERGGSTPGGLRVSVSRGSYRTGPDSLRCGSRVGYSATYRSYDLGFRLVRVSRSLS